MSDGPDDLIAEINTALQEGTHKLAEALAKLGPLMGKLSDARDRFADALAALDAALKREREGK